MLIDYRIAINTNVGKWSATKHDNKNKTNCDLCGSHLWLKPDGKSKYCNKEHLMGMTNAGWYTEHKK